MRLYFQKLEHIGASDWKTLCLSKNNIYPIFRRTSIYYIWISYDNAYPIPYDVDKKVLSHLPRNPIGGHLRDLSINTYVTLTIAFLITQTHMSSLFTLQRIFNIWLPLLRVQRNHSSWNKISKWQISLATSFPLNFRNNSSRIPQTPSPPSLRSYWMFLHGAYFQTILQFNLSGQLLPANIENIKDTFFFNKYQYLSM